MGYLLKLKNGLFTKIKERMQKVKETGDSRYICQTELDKTYLLYYIAYKHFSNLPWKTASDKDFMW